MASTASQRKMVIGSTRPFISSLIGGRAAWLSHLLTAWEHFLSQSFSPCWKSCFPALLFVPLCHPPKPSVVLTFKPARRQSGSGYFLLLHSSCGSPSNPHLPDFCLKCTSLSLVSLTCSLVFIFLQSGSILRHWHADYIMDPLADQWPLYIKRGLALLFGPSWPILALIRWLSLSANGRGATLWKIGTRQKQSNASQVENKNNTLSKSISPLTRGRLPSLPNRRGGYTTTLVVFFLRLHQKSLSIIYQLELFNLV